MLFKQILIILISSCILLSGCSSSEKETYARSEANRIQVPTTQSSGVIEAIEVVNLDGEASWVGSTSGSLVGGVLGSTVGSGWGSIASSIVGSIAVSFAGRGAEKQLTKTQGLKMIIRRDDGFSFTAIIIPEKGQHFKVGDRVHIVSSANGNVQITAE